MGYKDSYSPAAQFCFPPAEIPQAHTFNFFRPWCHLAGATPFSSCCWMCHTQIQPAHWSLVPFLRFIFVAGIIHIPQMLVASLLFIHLPTLLCCIQCVLEGILWTVCNLFWQNHPDWCYFPHQIELTLVIFSTLLLKSSSKKWEHSVFHLAHRLEKWPSLRLKFMFKLFYIIFKLVIENDLKIDYVVKC